MLRIRMQKMCFPMKTWILKPSISQKSFAFKLALAKKVKQLKRLPKIQKGMRASGIWERKISPAGVQYLKMADEVSEE